MSDGRAFEAGVPKRLFPAPPTPGWDVSADGKRFLLAVPENGSEGASPPITVLLNWQAELKKRRLAPKLRVRWREVADNGGHQACASLVANIPPADFWPA
jgi:hypothetical protein